MQTIVWADGDYFRIYKNNNITINISVFRLPSSKNLHFEQQQESYLTASFIHPLVQALFSLEFATRVAYW